MKKKKKKKRKKNMMQGLIGLLPKTVSRYNDKLYRDMTFGSAIGWNLYCNRGGLAGEADCVTIKTLYRDCSCLNGWVVLKCIVTLGGGGGGGGGASQLGCLATRPARPRYGAGAAPTTRPCSGHDTTTRAHTWVCCWVSRLCTWCTQPIFGLSTVSESLFGHCSSQKIFEKKNS